MALSGSIYEIAVRGLALQNFNFYVRLHVFVETWAR
jgi:hypothetical protein